MDAETRAEAEDVPVKRKGVTGLGYVALLLFWGAGSSLIWWDCMPTRRCQNYSLLNAFPCMLLPTSSLHAQHP